MSSINPEHIGSAGAGGLVALVGTWLFKSMRHARAEGRLEQRVTSLERQLQEFRLDVKADLRELRDLLMKRE